MTTIPIADHWIVLLPLALALAGAWLYYGVIRRFKTRKPSFTSKVQFKEELSASAASAAQIDSPDQYLTGGGPGAWDASAWSGVLPHRSIRRTRESLENLLATSAIFGDLAMITLGFVVANLLCEWDAIPLLKAHESMPSISHDYWLIICVSLIVLWGLRGKELYTIRCLLNPSKARYPIIESLGVSFLAFVAFSLVVKTDPSIPLAFLGCSAFFVLVNLYNWRVVLSQIIRRLSFFSALRQRLVVIGGGALALQLKNKLDEYSAMEFVGWVQANKPNTVAELEQYCLGSLHELNRILKRNAVDVAVFTEPESLQREGVLAVAKACENEHVQFKMVPHFFEILVSGLRPDTIGGLEVLGVDSLPLGQYRNRAVKRAIDIMGGLVGLALAIPIIIVCGFLVYRESPGPILYKQLRQGRNGRLFYIIKIRSMHLNAEAEGRARWAQENDHRRLSIGAFCRRWNLDEVPQFWNVLVGDMSLVGPRPERPELIARFKTKIPHYQVRHNCTPGLTGWAQVNGWRGNTDLEKRIRHDIWYLENWSVWLDLYIMLRTFCCRKNAY
jgi:exopolysaccharide biosynthesis polyprenyl glycosylphosphotransferase